MHHEVLAQNLAWLRGVALLQVHVKTLGALLGPRHLVTGTLQAQRLVMHSSGAGLDRLDVEAVAGELHSASGVFYP